jgi:integrase
LLPTKEGWLFANPATEKKHIRAAAKAAGIKFPVGWKTFRHNYRSWLDQTDAPIGVQRELMRHASIQATMNVYGRAMTDSKRQAHNKRSSDGAESRISGNHWGRNRVNQWAQG